MSILRKAFLPAAVVLGFLMFLGAIGATPTAQAHSVEAICGPEFISVDETALYFILAAEDEDEEDDTDIHVDLDDKSGDSDITSATSFEGYEELDEPTDVLTDVEVFFDEGDIGDLFEDLDDEFGVELDEDLFRTLLDCVGDDEEDFAEDILEAIVQCIDTSDCENDWTETDPGSDLTFPGDIGISPADIAEFMAEAILDDPELLFDCEDLGDAVEDFLIAEGVSEEIAEDIRDDVIEDICGFEEEVFGFNGIGVVDVTCNEAGEFDLSVAFKDDTEDDTQAQIEVTCVGEVDEGLITATPNKVEIVPAKGSTSFSLIVVELLDEDGEAVAAGVEVDFATDRCVFQDEDGLTLEDYLELVNLFEEFNVNDASTAADIEAFMADNDLDDDSDDVSNAVDSFILPDDTDDFDEGDSLAVAILDCSDTSTVPGVANVTFQIDQPGGDIVGSVKVTVVGPPASITVAASPTSLVCGEKATITVTVKDSAGQNVSDHTLVEAVTNAGGVLGGTGAVAAGAGLVSPISSTVAETVNGVATIFLLTSDTHVGAYEVVIATGGGGAVASGGVFSTAAQTAQATVTCSNPSAVSPAAPSAPTVTAPRTGGGITPPNTGDAGLASGSDNGTLFAVVGMAVFAFAGLATLKLARR